MFTIEGWLSNFIFFLNRLILFSSRAYKAHNQTHGKTGKYKGCRKYTEHQTPKGKKPNYNGIKTMMQEYTNKRRSIPLHQAWTSQKSQDRGYTICANMGAEKKAHNQIKAPNNLPPARTNRNSSPPTGQWQSCTPTFSLSFEGIRSGPNTNRNIDKPRSASYLKATSKTTPWSLQLSSPPLVTLHWKSSHCVPSTTPITLPTKSSGNPTWLPYYHQNSPNNPNGFVIDDIIRYNTTKRCISRIRVVSIVISSAFP